MKKPTSLREGRREVKKFANIIARRAATKQPAAGVPSVSEGSQDRFVGLCLLAITGVSA